MAMRLVVMVLVSLCRGDVRSRQLDSRQRARLIGGHGGSFLSERQRMFSG